MNNDDSFELSNSVEQDDIARQVAVAIIRDYHQYAMPFITEVNLTSGLTSGQYEFSLPICALGEALRAVGLPGQKRGLLSLKEKAQSLSKAAFKKREANLATYTCTLGTDLLRITNTLAGVSCEVDLPLAKVALGIPVDGLSFTLNQERAQMLFSSNKALLSKFTAGKLTKLDWEVDVCQFRYIPDKETLAIDPSPRTHLELQATPAEVRAPLRRVSEFADAMPISGDDLCDAISRASIFSRNDPQQEMASVISIENGSALGGDNSRVVQYENKALVCPDINITVRQKGAIQALLRRCRPVGRMAIDGTTVIFGNDILRCELEQFPRKFPPLPNYRIERLTSARGLMLDQRDVPGLFVLTIIPERDPIAQFTVVEDQAELRIDFKLESVGGRALVGLKVKAEAGGAKVPVGISGRIRVSDLIKICFFEYDRRLTLYLSHDIGVLESSADGSVCKHLFMYPELPNSLRESNARVLSNAMGTEGEFPEGNAPVMTEAADAGEECCEANASAESGVDAGAHCSDADAPVGSEAAEAVEEGNGADAPVESDGDSGEHCSDADTSAGSEAAEACDEGCGVDAAGEDKLPVKAESLNEPPRPECAE